MHRRLVEHVIAALLSAPDQHSSRQQHGSARTEVCVPDIEAISSIACPGRRRRVRRIIWMKTARQYEPARCISGSELHEAVLQPFAGRAVSGLKIDRTVRSTRKAVACLPDSRLAIVWAYHIDRRLRQV